MCWGRRVCGFLLSYKPFHIFAIVGLQNCTERALHNCNCIVHDMHMKSAFVLQYDTRDTHFILQVDRVGVGSCIAASVCKTLPVFFFIFLLCVLFEIGRIWSEARQIYYVSNGE